MTYWIEITLGGHVYTWATVATSTRPAGLGLLAIEQGTDSVSVVIQADPPGGWAALAALWPLEGAPASIGRGDDEVVLVGQLVGPRWGAPGSGLSAQVTAIDLEPGEQLPPALAVVDATTWPDATIPDAALGAAYPVVIGCPGATGGTTRIAAVPVELVDDPAIGGATWLLGIGPIGASNVLLEHRRDDEIVQAASVTVRKDIDGRGQAVAVLREADASPHAPTGDTPGTWWAGYSVSAGGGLTRAGGTDTARGAADVIERLLIGSGTAIDRNKWAQHAAFFNQYQVDTYIDEPVDPWAWCESEIVAMLPARVMRSAAGVWLQPMRWDARPEDATAVLTEGRDGVARDGLVTYRDRPSNIFPVRYGRYADGYYAALRLTGRGNLLVEPAPTADTRVISSARCLRSQQLYGPRYAAVLELAHTWDPATAARIAADRAAELALPHRVVSYAMPAARCALSVGDVVIVEDPDVSIHAAALVERVSVDGVEALVDLAVLTGADVVVTEAEPPPAGVAPTITSASISPSGSQSPGDTLTASATTTGDSPVTLSYQWRRNGTDISGATSAAYTLVTADAGTTPSVVITATNAFGSDTATVTGSVTNVYGVQRAHQTTSDTITSASNAPVLPSSTWTWVAYLNFTAYGTSGSSMFAWNNGGTGNLFGLNMVTTTTPDRARTVFRDTTATLRSFDANYPAGVDITTYGPHMVAITRASTGVMTCRIIKGGTVVASANGGANTFGNGSSVGAILALTNMAGVMAWAIGDEALGSTELTGLTDGTATPRDLFNGRGTLWAGWQVAAADEATIDPATDIASIGTGLSTAWAAVGSSGGLSAEGE